MAKKRTLKQGYTKKDQRLDSRLSTVFKATEEEKLVAIRKAGCEAYAKAKEERVQNREKLL